MGSFVLLNVGSENSRVTEQAVSVLELGKEGGGPKGVYHLHYSTDKLLKLFLKAKGGKDAEGFVLQFRLPPRNR